MEQEETEKHGTTDWKSHIHPSLYEGLPQRNAGMESRQGRSPASTEAGIEVGAND